MVRRYGRALGGKRVVDHSPLNKPKNITLISAMSRDGVFAQMKYQGGTTKEIFLQYIKEILLPTLKPGDIVIMDNLSAHHGPEVAQLIGQAGASVLYLPPYSPDMNPIEKLWSKIKAYLRKCRSLTFDSLEKALQEAFSKVIPSDCKNWFACAGYC